MSQAWVCECGARCRGHWHHCVVCHLTFGGEAAFNAHLKSLVVGGCRTAAELVELIRKDGTLNPLVPRLVDGVEVWSRPLPEGIFAPTRVAD